MLKNILNNLYESFLIGGPLMNTEVMYSWKEKDYKDKDPVKDIVTTFIKGLDSINNAETFQIQIAQSDRLIDFSILVTVEKKLESLGGNRSLENWRTLELTHPELETSRLFIDKKTGTEIEIFHLPNQLNYSIFTYVHFKEPTLETNKIKETLEQTGKEVSQSFINVLDFLKI